MVNVSLLSYFVVVVPYYNLSLAVSIERATANAKIAKIFRLSYHSNYKHN